MKLSWNPNKIRMNTKSQTIIFMWIVTTTTSVLMTGFDFIGDSRINWANYFLLGTFVVTAISSAAILFFTFPCHVCGKLVILNNNYCNKCGTNLIKKATFASHGTEIESSMELPPILGSIPESRPLSFTRVRREKIGALKNQ